MYRLAIEDETFDEVREAFNAMLQHTVNTMAMQQNPEGAITLKLSIVFEDDQVVDQNGAVHKITVPVFKHTVSNVVQSKSSMGGAIAMQRQLCKDARGQWALRDIPTDQLDMWDDEEEEYEE